MYFDELDNFPDAFLIGSDPGGNLYLADFNGKSNTYYWDRQKIHNWDQVDTLDGVKVGGCIKWILHFQIFCVG